MDRVLYLPESVLKAWEAAEPSYFIKNKIMKYGIICMVDGDPDRSMPIVGQDDDSCMATWDSLEEAKNFALRSVLCQISSVIYIDLENGTLDF